MTIKKKLKRPAIKPKTKPRSLKDLPEPPVIEPEAPVVDEVGDIETEQREADLSDLQRTLAETEARLDNLNLEIEAKVTERVQQALSSISPFLVQAEFRITEKLIEFFQQLPEWEIQRVTREDVGASNFYSPYEYFKNMINRGWRYMGRHFDETSKQNYELFMRPKKLPARLKDFMKFYEEFSKKADTPASKTLAEAKASDGLKRKQMLIKTKTHK